MTGLLHQRSTIDAMYSSMQRIAR